MRLLRVITASVGAFAAAHLAADGGRPATLPQLPAGVSAFFSPKHDLETEILKLIDGAAVEVLVHQYAFTSPGLAKGLLRARDRGVIVVVLLDPSPSYRDYQSPGLLATAGLNVRLADITRGRDNNRYLIIDGETVATGTFEWTTTARQSSQDNLVVIREPSLAATFIEHFRESMIRSTVAAAFESEPTAEPTADPANQSSPSTDES